MLVLVTVLMALAAAYGATPREPAYTATATLFVGTAPSDPRAQSGEVSVDRLTGFSILAATFTQMIDSHPVASLAIDRAEVARTVDEVLDSTTALNAPGTQLIEIDVTDRDPGVARDLADALAQSFIVVLEDQERAQQVSSGGEAGIAPVSVFAPALVPTEPLDNGLGQSLMLGMLFGLIAAIGLVVLLEYLDLTVRTAEDAERRIGLPVLGTIPATGDVAVAPGVRGAGRRPGLLVRRG